MLTGTTQDHFANTLREYRAAEALIAALTADEHAPQRDSRLAQLAAVQASRRKAMRSMAGAWPELAGQVPT